MQLRRPCTEPEFLVSADVLDAAVVEQSLRQFCQNKIASAESEDAKNEWQFMNILFETDARRRLMDFIGFSSADVAQQVRCWRVLFFVSGGAGCVQQQRCVRPSVRRQPRTNPQTPRPYTRNAKLTTQTHHPPASEARAGLRAGD